MKIQRRHWMGASALAGALSGLGLTPGTALAQTAGAVLRVAAASDLQFALAELVRRFQQETGIAVQVSYGSSGHFARQIAQGLPVDLFLSADEALVFQLADAGLTQGRGTLYAVGRLALVVPRASDLPLDPGLRGLMRHWAAVHKFAIANPEHAPYGRAAQQALEQLGCWGLVQRRLVLGDNIAQATQFVAAGAAQAGMTALSLALAPELAGSLRHVVLPQALHAPLRQRMVLLTRAGPSARQLHAYLQGAAARAVLARHGFEAP